MCGSLVHLEDGQNVIGLSSSTCMEVGDRQHHACFRWRPFGSHVSREITRTFELILFYLLGGSIPTLLAMLPMWYRWSEEITHFLPSRLGHIYAKRRSEYAATNYNERGRLHPN